MAELKPYDPSWRERAAQALMGDGKASPERRRLVLGLLGTSGLGDSSLNVADVSPLGLLFSANEYARAETPGQALQAAMGFIQAARPASQGVKMATKAPDFLASRSSFLYDPPIKSSRPFAADYPMGSIADDAGKLTSSIDGTPLTARYIAGRSMAGGGDVAIPREAFDEVAKAATGQGISEVPSSALGRDLGRVAVNTGSRQPVSVVVRGGLPEVTGQRVAAHEIGHVIDQVAGEIPTKGLSDELQAVYNSLNNGQRNAADTDARLNAKAFLPQHGGYKADDIPREYMAEAIRAYMSDPNYLKTVAPKTAMAIRKSVNSNDKLSGIIQFNSYLAPIGGLGLLAAQQDAQAAPAQ